VYLYSMKSTLILIFITVFSGSFSQTSYDFAIPVPPRAREVKAVNVNYFGTYMSENSPFTYEFNETGIYVISTNINSISKETVRESTTYTVRNEHIFGVKENDSIPCVLEDNRYYFGIKNREKIGGYASKNVLLELKMNQYVLNFEEKGKYIPLFLTFSAEGLSLEQFDYDGKTMQFESIDEKTTVTTDIINITLDPTPSEWKKLNLEELKSVPVLYKK
jgi:hypothetical protein